MKTSSSWIYARDIANLIAWLEYQIIMEKETGHWLN